MLRVIMLSAVMLGVRLPIEEKTVLWFSIPCDTKHKKEFAVHGWRHQFLAVLARQAY
jgi:hypothetical protein